VSGDQQRFPIRHPQRTGNIAVDVTRHVSAIATGQRRRWSPEHRLPNDTYPVMATTGTSPSSGTLTAKGQLGANVAPPGAIEMLSTGVSSGHHYLDEFYNPTANQTTGQTFELSIDIAGNYSGVGTHQFRVPDLWFPDVGIGG